MFLNFVFLFLQSAFLIFHSNKSENNLQQAQKKIQKIQNFHQKSRGKRHYSPPLNYVFIKGS
jgi:hypothetical protein